METNEVNYDNLPAVMTPAQLIGKAQNVADVTREIVTRTAIKIQGRKYVRVEGWQAIAIAHGCVLSARDVTRVDGDFSGYSAVGEVRRADNGVVIATAEGFVGDDEKTWRKRDEYAKRAMAQTRAMSRAGRSAFAHVVIMIDSDMSTTPAGEVPEGGFKDTMPTSNGIPLQLVKKAGNPDKAIQAIQSAKSIDEIDKIHKQLEDRTWEEGVFIDLCDAVITRKQEIIANLGAPNAD